MYIQRRYGKSCDTATIFDSIGRFKDVTVSKTEPTHYNSLAYFHRSKVLTFEEMHCAACYLRPWHCLATSCPTRSTFELEGEVSCEIMST